MSKKNKFGFAPLDDDAAKPRERSVGPIGAAIRDAAENLSESTEAKIEQRRQNAEDAKAYRRAATSGMILERVAIGDVHTNQLPRDRLDLDSVAASEEMEELKTSIRARGQREPIELYLGEGGRLQLKKGWRRLTALRQLFAETGDDAFDGVIARVDRAEQENGAQLSRYIDMVEENVVREDLSFSEMAQVAVTAADDIAVSERDPHALVGKLYGALHKTKRSYIRSFVTLMNVLREDLKWPKQVPRNIGVDTARTISAGQVDVQALKISLRNAPSAEAQNDMLRAFAASEDKPSQLPTAAPKQKFEFHLGKTKVTARQGECRIVSKIDYASVPQAQLERAIRAFEDVLKTEDGPRVRGL